MLTNDLAVGRRCFQNVKTPSVTSVWNERDLELSFGGLNYSFSLFSSWRFMASLASMQIA